MRRGRSPMPRTSSTLPRGSTSTTFVPAATGIRHACGVELLRRSNGNLRAVQEHLRHVDIQTTTVYTRLTPSDLQKVISAFDNNNGGENGDSRPSPHGT